MPIVLAADFGGLLAIAFLLISFVGWIVNLINAQNPPPAPNRGPQARPRPRDRKVQNEIEQFLQEAMGQKRKQPQTHEVADDEIEILEPAPQRRGPEPRSPQSRQPSAQPAASRPTPVASAGPEQPDNDVRSRHVVPSTQLGQGVVSYVQEHLREHVGRDARRYLGDTVDQDVTQHLGEFTADDYDPRSSVKPQRRSRARIGDPAQFMADLRRPEGMRKAVLLQEILSKPRALRK